MAKYKAKEILRGTLNLGGGKRQKYNCAPGSVVELPEDNKQVKALVGLGHLEPYTPPSTEPKKP